MPTIIKNGIQYGGGGDNSRGSKIIVTTNEETLINKAVSITDGKNTESRSFDNQGNAIFDGITLSGELTVFATDGSKFAQQIINILYFGNYSVDINFGLQLSDWLIKAGLNPEDYADFNEVEADEKAVRKLMTIHNAVDYLATAEADDELMIAVINSDICAKWINLRDYALDTLYANTDIASAMDTADKYFYGEWVITDDTTTPVTWGPKGNVPIMTSNTAPYGTAFRVSGTVQKEAWYAFDGNENDGCEIGDSGNWELGYKFINPVCVKKVYIYTRNAANYGTKTLVIRASNDKTTWTPLAEVETTYNTKYNVDLNNTQYYMYYEVFNVSASYGGLKTLQFYGREMKNAILPTMTSNTAPYGVLSGTLGTGNYSSYQMFNRGSGQGGCSENTTLNAIYTFVAPVEAEKLIFYMSRYKRAFDLIVEVRESENAEWETVLSIESARNDDFAFFSCDINTIITSIRFRSTVGKSSGNDLYLKQVQIYGHYVSFERYYLYDHGVELEPIATDGTKKNDCITLTVSNQTAVATLDTTDYTAMGGYVGKNASGTNQLICGSSTSNFSLANLPDGNAIDISSVNGTNSVGVKQTANGTFDIEEIWLSSN